MAKGKLRKTSSFSRSKGRAVRRDGSAGDGYVAKRLRVVDVDDIINAAMTDEGMTEVQARSYLQSLFDQKLLQTDGAGVTVRTMPKT
jgi:hypothetical protein